MKQRYLLSLVLCFPFLLTWCFNILDWNWIDKSSQYTTAEQVCLDNNWEITTDSKWTPICLLWDRWINLEDMEEHPEKNIDQETLENPIE